MPDYPITPGAVTDPFCPTTWQQVLEEFSNNQVVTLPEINGFIAQETEPGVADQGKVWIRTSVSAPYVIGIYSFQGGGWRPIPAPVGFTYFVDTGAANAWVITTGESIPDNAAFVTGRLWAIRINNSVTSATTLVIDSFAAKSVKKQNTTDLGNGDVTAGQIVLAIYDATAGEFELITTLGDAPAATETSIAGLAVPAGSAGATTSWAHGLGARPRHVDVTFVCVNASAGYTTGQEFDLPFLKETAAADNEQAYLYVERTTTSIILHAPITGVWYVHHNTTGTITGVTAADWSVSVEASL